MMKKGKVKTMTKNEISKFRQIAQQNVNVLRYAPKEVFDQEFVTSIVMQNHGAISYVPVEYINMDIAKKIIETEIQFFSTVIRVKDWTDEEYTELCNVAFKESKAVIISMDGSKVSNYFELCKDAAREFPYMIGILNTSKYISDEQKDTLRNIALLCKISKERSDDSLLMRNEYYNTEDQVIKALDHLDAYYVISHSICDMTEKIIYNAIIKHPHSVAYFSSDALTDEILIKAIKVSPAIFSHLDIKRRTYDICKIAVSIDGSYLEYVPEEIRCNHYDIILDAIDNDESAIECL